MNQLVDRSRLAGRLGLLVALLAASPAWAQAPFELKNGDRVVMLGGTFIEREQTYGYLEALLTSRYPDRNITFRNLGWSGDTVWGEARSRFGPPAEGFAHLKEHVEALKPTVIFVCYGLNESFAGKPGLPRFEQGLNTLLDVLDKTGARIVMITPRRLEKLPPPLPDPKAANDRLGDYVGVLRKAAAARKYRLVDLFDGWLPDPGFTVTEDGLQLTEEGYAIAALQVGLSLSPLPLNFFVATEGRQDRGRSPATASKVEDIRAVPGGVKFRVLDPRLPIAARGAHANGTIRVVSFEEFEPGPHELRIDGQHVGTYKVGEKLRYVNLRTGPEFDQFERLRTAINAKNELYFYRWRPQNETYLFGFRKHEQGNNAREIPLFDPLVAAKEAEIAKLRIPVSHNYEIIKKGDSR